MDTLVDLLYSKTVGVSFLIVLILAVRPFVLEKMNAKLAYQLWLVIPLYLALPTFNTELQSSAASWTFYLGQDLSLPKLPPISANISQKSFEIFMLVWLIGFIAALSIYWIKYRRLSKSLKTSNFRPTHNLTKDYLAQANRQFDFVESDLVNSPAIFGMTRAKVILPKDFLRQDFSQRQIILNHELFHIRRRDHQINQVRNLIKCLFWFNPILLLADKYFEADQEL
ncbi:MAG: hypothetical protein OQJ89_02020, partial [Kangiellaceae bacterium]|nr:hypothetical protein [Kangiellaceae bacterium]